MRISKAKTLILEKGMLPQRESKKNAGFAWFRSLSEIISELKTHTEKELIDLVKQRINGLQLLRNTLGDKTIDDQQLGGYELFNEADNLFENCIAKKEEINNLLKPIFNTEVFSLKENGFNFQNIKNQYSFNQFEGQIDTGKMMESLLKKALLKGIKILNNVFVEGITAQ